MTGSSDRGPTGSRSCMGSRLTPHKNQGDRLIFPPQAQHNNKMQTLQGEECKSRQQPSKAPQCVSRPDWDPVHSPSSWSLPIKRALATLFPFLLLPLLLMVKHTSNFRPWIASLSSGSSRTILQVFSPTEIYPACSSVGCPLSLCISPPFKSFFDPTSSSVLNFH